ncbi:MAG TPA: GatB/YqeY domain-containing protein [Alteromonas australica]|uniref:GatB/YqeY domain-containing protein n=1 Tax=Alteromonas australica TaxID=589873 RepID=A0A075NTF5_9ALTE|nr:MULTISPECIES: GatB/YqeY domain-containing protein [Alteromonas]MAB93890.1 glutamyl-tRNA amidotransferase [Alteromonas sp.]AIF97824.1 glutamyl-tRNA amidotransferase [Alteromonas australica]AJP42907.1 glutamyl-tRNA amidotransferase [Alteromonas australica]MAF72227.1 glutamyl-tRNA amidotransferase [Alteromonas sp.]MAO31714.1 glutamyl-tRNA amidotransferase [Alteromonas sp.]
MALIDELKNAQKDAMRAKDKVRLGTIRMALAAIKQKEIDEQITLDDTAILAVLTKMVKQRVDAASQFDAANRDDLASKEREEIVVIEAFLPKPLSEDELNSLIDDAMASTGASGMQDMGKVMGVLKPQVQGRADMGALSGKIKARLNA